MDQLLESNLKTLNFEIDGKLISGLASYDRGVLWVHLNGETFVVESKKSERRRGGKAGTGGASYSGEIQAPMPGKIIKIMVESGDSVEIHQVLIVMEAMKMEYTLKAPMAGTVNSVDCTPGQQVVLGQLLVRLEPMNA
jgi:biotin carboxyl carrier protein